MRCDTPFKHEIEKEAMSHIKMADGTYSRTYTLYDMPKSINAAWIGNLFGIANEVHIWFQAGQAVCRKKDAPYARQHA